MIKYHKSIISIIDNQSTTLFNNLLQNNYMFTSAESITGGMITSYLIDNIGSGKIIYSGITSYNLLAKKSILNVTTKDIYSHTAVRQMSINAIKLMEQDIKSTNLMSIATSGFASGKNMGKVHIGISILSPYYQLNKRLFTENINKLYNEIIYCDILNYSRGRIPEVKPRSVSDALGYNKQKLLTISYGIDVSKFLPKISIDKKESKNLVRKLTCIISYKLANKLINHISSKSV